MPVLAATDVNTDVGEIIEQAQCGYWVEAGDIQAMLATLDKFCNEGLQFQKMQKNSWDLLNTEYYSELSYNLIINAISEKRRK
jgi:hypothetical protein